jgi:hypothetical protein
MTRTWKIAASLAAATCLLAILALPSAAAAKDRNHDRIPDRWEKRHHLSLRVNQARHDQDRDGLRNRAEFMAGDNPLDPDTDDDGVPDGEENAGKIASFDAATGKLTIDLFGGETISGAVTEETEIECEDSASASDQQGEDGQEEPDDDNQGDDDDQGACSTADLVPGAVVQEAELDLANGMATFEEVELAG